MALSLSTLIGSMAPRGPQLSHDTRPAAQLGGPHPWAWRNPSEAIKAPSQGFLTNGEVEKEAGPGARPWDDCDRKESQLRSLKKCRIFTTLEQKEFNVWCLARC